jgi:hypothetical protein
MTFSEWISLAIKSVTDPRDVARWILAQHLNRETLLTGLALSVVLNTLVFFTSLMITPGAVPVILATPIGFLAIQATVLILTILGLHGAARMMGGTGGLEDVAALLIWMQYLRVLIQLVALVLFPISPFLIGIVMSISSFAGLWILLNFLDEAHNLGGLMKSAVVLVFGILGMAFALSLLLVFLGVDPNGMAEYV